MKENPEEVRVNCPILRLLEQGVDKKAPGRTQQPRRVWSNHRTSRATINIFTGGPTLHPRYQARTPPFLYFDGGSDS